MKYVAKSASLLKTKSAPIPPQKYSLALASLISMGTICIFTFADTLMSVYLKWSLKKKCSADIERPAESSGLRIRS